MGGQNHPKQIGEMGPAVRSSWGAGWRHFRATEAWKARQAKQTSIPPECKKLMDRRERLQQAPTASIWSCRNPPSSSCPWTAKAWSPHTIKQRGPSCKVGWSEAWYTGPSAGTKSPRGFQLCDICNLKWARDKAREAPSLPALHGL